MEDFLGNNLIWILAISIMMQVIISLTLETENYRDRSFNLKELIKFEDIDTRTISKLSFFAFFSILFLVIPFLLIYGGAEAILIKYLSLRVYSFFIPLIIMLISLIGIIKVVITGKCSISNITLEKIVNFNIYMFVLFILPAQIEILIVVISFYILGEAIEITIDKFSNKLDNISNTFNHACAGDKK